MNYKRTLCYLAISALATSLHADTANEQELHGQLAVKQQELHELGQKIIKQEERIRESYRKMQRCIIEDIEKKKKEQNKSDSNSEDTIRNELANDLGSFFHSFWKEHKKDLLFNEFLKDMANPDSYYAFIKFHAMHILYDRITLLDLVRQWEETAQQVNAILVQMGHWITK